MRTALRTLEGLLLDGGGRTARRNAWQAVLEDRSRARGRAEAERLLTAMSSPATPVRPAAASALQHGTTPTTRGTTPVPPAGASALLHAT